MKLQTQIPLQPQKFNQIDYKSEVVLLGSCFSENIGVKFQDLKFQTTLNPFGILFHAVAIETLVTRAINSDYYEEDEFIFTNEQWACYDAHSKLNHADKAQLTEVLNGQLDSTRTKLEGASHIILTLGTSWVYRQIALDRIVANCHKVPQKQFLKELLSVDEISNSLDAIMALIRTINPMVIFIFTVSPVRHIKDGFIENTQSKAHLIAAIHQLIDDRKQQYYFPSYEIMMDELRDYRFYNSDMLHPSDLAVDLIWDRFKKTWMSTDTLTTMEDVEGILKGLSHKPFNSNSEAHQQFVGALNDKIAKLEEQWPQIKF